MPLSGEVLIVDDTPENLQVLSAILRAEGLNARLAPHGAFALASVQARLPDLVLLDVHMPGLDGFETCRRLRDDPATCAVPVLFLSASDTAEERVAAFTAGGLDFISKPFNAAEVVARVSTHLTLARLRRELALANTKLAGCVRDEQAQRLLVERLAADRQVRLDLALDAAGMGIWALAGDGAGIVCDAEACALLGCAPTMSGGWAEFAAGFAAEDRARLEAAWQAGRHRGQPFECEGWWQAAGDRRRIRIRGRSAGPGEQGMLGLVWNVTREHGFQARLAQSEKLESLGRMAGGLAHDFNNHLAVLVGNFELLDAAVGRVPGVRRRLDTIDRTITAATALVRSLLTFARRRTVEMEVIRPTALLGDLHEMLASVLGRQIRVVREADDDALVVEASREQLQNALLNLCVNARDAMPEGGELTLGAAEVAIVSEHCRICGEEITGSFVSISVRDTGAGIPFSLQERIFEPFFTTKAEGQGTGLGLAAVAGCVTTHHGHLLLDSTPGGGSCFRILLPLAQAAVGDGSAGAGSGAATAVGRKAMAAMGAMG